MEAAGGHRKSARDVGVSSWNLPVLSFGRRPQQPLGLVHESLNLPEVITSGIARVCVLVEIDVKRTARAEKVRQLRVAGLLVQQVKRSIEVPVAEVAPTALLGDSLEYLDRRAPPLLGCLDKIALGKLFVCLASSTRLCSR